MLPYKPAITNHVSEIACIGAVSVTVGIIDAHGDARRMRSIAAPKTQGVKKSFI